MKCKVVLYGSGERCRVLCRILTQLASDIEITAIADSNPDKWGCQVEGYLIDSPDRIGKIQDTYLCITVADRKAVCKIREMFRKNGWPVLENEIHYNRLIFEAYRQCDLTAQFVTVRKLQCHEEKSILFDCYNGLGLGGVETWTMDLCSALIKSGNEEVYIITNNGTYEVPVVIYEKIIYTDINSQGRFSVDSVRNLIQIIMKKLPCKLITSAVNEVMLAGYLVKVSYPDEIQIISVIHNSSERDYEEYMDFRECTDLYIGVSRDIRADMVQRGIAEDKISSMTCPFPCESFLDRGYSESAAMPICIGYAGRLEYEQKRMDLILKLIEALVKDNIHFIMEIAGDGSARKELEEFVALHYLNEKVRILGRLDRSLIPEFWKRQDVCVNLADYEGRSISIIEAMGNGAVPVVTATSGVREDITDTVNGYIVPVGDYCAIADRIRMLDRERALLPKMGKLAHAAVAPKSRMKKHVEFWKDILR